ncbi:hypothetical protein K456DRAFT_43418 [Colletotrichum gloeosporioides 23]|nr:hypothetical protein K456DRAFT_43418 [Colletotrichum gloeosporioides 23]
MAYSNIAIACMDEYATRKLDTSIRDLQDHLYNIAHFRAGENEPSTAEWLSDRQAHPGIFAQARSAVSERHVESLQEQAEIEDLCINEIIESRYREVLVEFYNILSQKRESEYGELFRIKELQSDKRTNDSAAKRARKRRFWNRQRASVIFAY